MDTTQFEIWVMDYLSGELDEASIQRFEKFLTDNEEYQKQFDVLLSSWEQLNALEVPEPSEKMDTQFFEMLSNATEKNDKIPWYKKLQMGIRQGMDSLVQSKLAYGALVLILGLTLGYFFRNGATEVDASSEMASTSETKQVREKLVLTLLEQPSANQRLQGVSEANKFEKVDDKVVNALLKTLNNDPNVNVRLAAIESLIKYVDNPLVREGLVQSIVKQESPILQVTLANLMVALQEKKSIEPFRKLMRTKELDTTVIQQIERSIETII